MGKSCCAYGCTHRCRKGCGLQFYRFPTDSDRKSKWVASIGRKNWKPTEYSWICSAHFVGGKKSDDPASPANIPTLFSHISSTQTIRAEDNLVRYSRTKKTRRRRIEKFEDEANKRRREDTVHSNDSAHHMSMEIDNMSQLSQVHCSDSTVSTETDLTMDKISMLENVADNLSLENGELDEENIKLKEESITLRHFAELLHRQHRG